MQRVMGIITANYTSDDLGALTENRTIASLPFGGRYRLIDFPLSNMVNAGIQTVGLVMPYKYRSIIDHVGAGKEWGLDRKNAVVNRAIVGERSVVAEDGVFGSADPEEKIAVSADGQTVGAHKQGKE